MGVSFVGNYGNLSNDELIAEINGSNPECLQILILRHMPLVHRLAARYARDAGELEDFEQDGLIALYAAVRAYRPGQASFSSFAALCIRRALIAERRAAGRRRRIPHELLSPLEEERIDLADRKDPETIFLEKESLRSLTDTIRLELSALEYRVLLAFLSGESYAAIARSLGISQKSVDNALRRIRGKLRKKNSVLAASR